jgi:hypothetical protein
MVLAVQCNLLRLTFGPETSEIGLTIGTHNVLYVLVFNSSSRTDRVWSSAGSGDAGENLCFGAVLASRVVLGLKHVVSR